MKKLLIIITGVVTLCVIALLLLGNENITEPLIGCEDNEELKVYCNFMNPEDLALTPDGNFLIVAEFGGMAPLVEMTSGSLLDLSLVESYKFKSKNMGVGTVGLPHDGSLWIGSYHSDRIAEGNLSLSE